MLRTSFAPSCFYFTWLYRDAPSTKHKILLAPCCKWVGATSSPTLCACGCMSWTDLHLYLCYHKERCNSVEYQTPISFTCRFNNAKSTFHFPNLSTGPKHDKDTHAQCRDAKYFCTSRRAMSVVNNNSTSCCNALHFYFVRTWVKILMLRVSIRRGHLQEDVRLHNNTNNMKAFFISRFQFNALVYYIFLYSSTCFEPYCAHHQEAVLYIHSIWFLMYHSVNNWVI